MKRNEEHYLMTSSLSIIRYGTCRSTPSLEFRGALESFPRLPFGAETVTQLDLRRSYLPVQLPHTLERLLPPHWLHNPISTHITFQNSHHVLPHRRSRRSFGRRHRFAAHFDDSVRVDVDFALDGTNRELVVSRDALAEAWLPRKGHRSLREPAQCKSYSLQALDRPC